MKLSFSLQEFWNQREWPCGWQMTPVKLEKKDVYSRSLQLFPLPPPFGTGVYTQKNTRLGADPTARLGQKQAN